MLSGAELSSPIPVHGRCRGQERRGRRGYQCGRRGRHRVRSLAFAKALPGKNVPKDWIVK